MTLRQILTATLVLGSLVSVMAALLGFGNEQEFRYLGVVAVIFYAFVMIGLLFFGNDLFKRYAELLVLFSIIWVFIRAVHLSIDLEYFTYPNMASVTYTNFAFTMVMIAVSTIFLSFGFYLGLSKRPMYATFPRSFTTPPRFHIFLFSYVTLAFVLQFLASMMRYKEAPGPWWLLTMIFSADVLMMLLLAYAVSNWPKMRPRYRFLLFSLVGLFVVLRIFQGSKGGLFVVFTILAVAWVALGDRRPIDKKYLYWFCGLAALSVALFFLGHGFRLLFYRLRGEAFSLDLLWLNLDLILQFASLENQVAYTSSFPMIEMLLRRLSMLDYMLVMFNRDPINEYISPLYQLKVIYNTVAPGVPFEGSHLMSALLFKVAYGLTTYAEVSQNYHSDMLPLFGYLYVNFGGFFLPILIGIGFSFGLAYLFLVRFKSDFIWFFHVLGFYLFFDLIFGMGFDSWIQFILFFVVFFIVTMRAVFWFYKIVSTSTIKSLENRKHTHAYY